MARQRIINYHTSGTTAPLAEDIYYGELVVSHNSIGNTKIYTKVTNPSGDTESGKIATFIDEPQIDEKISNSVNGLATIVQNLANLTITDIKTEVPISATTKALVSSSCGNTVTISHVADKTAQSGFKKLATDTYGHVTGGTDVVIGDISGLQGFADAIQNAETKLAYSSAGTGNAVTSISVNDHTITANFGKEFSESGHKHDGSDITSGKVGIAYLPTSTEVNSSSDDTTIPTSKAVYDAVNGVVNDVKLSAVTPSSTTVKEEYALYNGNGVQLGDRIKIYKDQSLVSITLEDNDGSGKTGQYLKYTYIDVNGDTQSTYVNISSLLVEAEFKDGLVVNDNGEVRVNIDNTSESFLTVGENGVKLSGVQGAIDNAISGVDTKLQELSGSVQTLSSTTESFSAATVAGITGLDTKIDNETTRATTAENSISANVTTLSSATEEFSAATVAEIARVEGKLSDDEKVIAESFNQLRAKVDKVQEGAGLNADGSYAPHSTSNYISGATSLDDADMMLDSALKALEGSMTGYSKAFIINLSGEGSAEKPYKVDKTREEVAAALAANSPILLKVDYSGPIDTYPLIWATDYPGQSIVLQFGNVEPTLSYTTILLTILLTFSYQDGVGANVTVSSTQLATSGQVQTLSGSVVSIENREQNYASAITINGKPHTVVNNSVDLGSFLSANTAHIKTIQQVSNASAVTTTINYVTENGSASAATITQDLIIDCGTY